MELFNVIAAFSALAQETRLGIFRLLVKAGPEGLPAGEIAGALDLPGATLSFHLNHLRQSALIRQERQGRLLIYSVRFDTVQELMRFMMEDCCQGRISSEELSAACCAPKETAT